MAEERVQRRLAAILSADVVGYSRLIEADEAGTVARVKALQTDLIDPLVTGEGGRVVKLLGDGVLVEYPSAVDAVRNGLSIQNELAQRNADLPKDSRIEFRIGVNLGDVIIDGDDVHGDGVNVASRLEALCRPGEVYISASVFDQVSGKLNAAFEDLGEHEVKNISRPVRVYRATSAGDAGAKPRAIDDMSSLAEKPSIAVLPFTNMSGDPDQEFFSDGVTEDLITALSRIRWLLVIARNTTFLFKGRAVDVKEIAGELGVRYVLEGSVRKAGNRVRITGQLIDGATGNHIWANRYDRDITDIFELQDELTETIVAAIQPAMQQAEQERASRKRPESLDAWEAYQRGIWHVERRQDDDMLKGREMFRHAIELDPEFAPAYSGLSLTYSWSLYFANASPDIDAAFELARKAVALDQYDPLGHMALGYAYYVTKDHGRAISEVEMAIELNPSSAYSYYLLSGALVMSGEAERAIACAQTALRLSPNDSLIGPFTARLAHAHLFLGHHEEAVEWAHKAMRYPSISWPVHVFLVSALTHLKREAEAREALDNLLRYRPGMTISAVRDRLPVTDASYLDHLINGLREAGLPE